MFVITRNFVIKNLSWTFWYGDILTRDIYYIEHFFCFHPNDNLIGESRLTWLFLHVFSALEAAIVGEVKRRYGRFAAGEYLFPRDFVTENLSWIFWLGKIFTCGIYYFEHFFCLYPKDILIGESRLTWLFLHIFWPSIVKLSAFCQLKNKHCTINIEVSFLALQSWKFTRMHISLVTVKLRSDF